MNSASRKLGELLVDRHLVSKDVLEQLLAQEEATGVPVARLMVEDGHVREEDLLRTIADRVGMEFVELDDSLFEPDAISRIPEAASRSLTAIPIKMEDSMLVVAVADPFDPETHRQLEQVAGTPVTLALATRSSVHRALDFVHGPADKPDLQVVRDDGTIDEAPGPEHELEEGLHINDLLIQLVEFGGSDLHLTVGTPPQVRVNGDLRVIPDRDMMKPAPLRELIYSVLTERQRETLEETHELDCSHPVPGHGRFRVNVFFQRDSIGAVFRAIPSEIQSLSTLGLPPIVSTFADIPRGLVLVTGPTGSGKSTTLASIIDQINQTRPVHIMTVEDPIEFLHKHKKAIVNQREVGSDTLGFSNALRHVLRQDPDVILVGEIRDLETISTALTAAETGHLVFATLHTQDAPQSIDRVIDVFPPHQQQQVRIQLASALQAVVTQQLVPTQDGKGRAVASEVLLATPAIRNLIREGKVHQIPTAMQAGGAAGMVTMDQSLAELVKTNTITFELGVDRCTNVEDFSRLCGRL